MDCFRTVVAHLEVFNWLQLVGPSLSLLPLLSAKPCTTKLGNKMTVSTACPFATRALFK
jgi:hypothetical protein